jgi:hypothetical protein
LHEAFLRGVCYAEEEGVFVVQLGRFRGQVEVEDTPFWVVSYDADDGALTLTDGSSESIDLATLSQDPDGVLRIRVKSRFFARFQHSAQALFLDALEEREDAIVLRAGEAWLPVPELADA